MISFGIPQVLVRYLVHSARRIAFVRRMSYFSPLAGVWRINLPFTFLKFNSPINTFSVAVGRAAVNNENNPDLSGLFSLY